MSFYSSCYDPCSCCNPCCFPCQPLCPPPCPAPPCPTPCPQPCPTPTPSNGDVAFQTNAFPNNQPVSNDPTDPAFPFTVLSWNPNPSFNVGGVTYNTTGNYFTIPRTGWYNITVRATWADIDNDVGVRELFITTGQTVGPTNTILAADTRTAPLNPTRVTLSTTNHLTAGTRVRVSAFQGSDTNDLPIFLPSSGTVPVENNSITIKKIN